MISTSVTRGFQYKCHFYEILDATINKKVAKVANATFNEFCHRPQPSTLCILNMEELSD